jgi:hypothetical protein
MLVKDFFHYLIDKIGLQAPNLREIWHNARIPLDCYFRMLTEVAPRGAG